MKTKMQVNLRLSRYAAVSLVGLVLAALLLSSSGLYASWPTNAAVEMAFSEGTGTSTTNSGFLGGLATLDPGTTLEGNPSFTTNVPVGSYAPTGNVYAVNMGIVNTNGGRKIDLYADNGPSGTLGAFPGGVTICGWLNSQDNGIGSGGNRIAFALESPGGLGFDLMQQAAGSLGLNVNEYNSGHLSSFGVIPESAAGASSNWVFFAVTWDPSLASGQLRYYFGRGNRLAGLDTVRTYAGPSPYQLEYTGLLTVGNFSSVEGQYAATGAGSRTYRGMIDQLRIYTNVFTIDQVQEAQMERSVPAVSATVVRQPAGLTLLAGQDATFSVEANGSGLVTYQWRTNAVSVPGATNSTFTLSAVTTNQSYTLVSVLVDNALSPDPGYLSSNATLVVIPPPPGGAVIYPSADVFVEGNANDPNATGWVTYNAYSQDQQVNFGLAAANSTSTGRRRSYMLFTLGTNEVSSAKLKLYNYWGGPPVNGVGRLASAQVRIRGTAVETPVTFTEPAAGTYVTDFVPPDETNFVTIVTTAAGAVTNVGWYEFDITSWYNARPGQTTTLLLRSSATSGYDFPIYEDREGTAYSHGAGGTLANSGPRIEYFLAPPRFRTTSLVGGQLTLSGYYGPPGSNYVLLASADAAEAVANWTRVLTNQFDSMGHFSVTRSVGAAPGKTYYRLLVP